MPDTDLSRATWRKSSYSGGNGNCVEMAELPNGMIAVRDSKVPNGPAVTFNHAEWTACIASLKLGQMDNLG
ncbi:DUF397 domain-containing protein [Sphaerisporangium sp. NPDC051011]|uniref:DUF397 domain-containing protein n=1 Tax=Sphaerisporangium sp. NPDC051011 TaxID=3155792 RepID=UPI0033C178A5